MLRVATAFSGGFGSVEFALKYEKVEHETVFACEWLEPQRKSYLLNHGEPSSNFYKDIRDMDGNKYKGKIDLYHLSPPCQSYSIAGKRGGADDERGGLMFEAIRSISEVQPKIFTIENVKGLLSSNGGEDFKHIMADLSRLDNYTLCHGVMNAREQGTPQNRERLFIVGIRADMSQMPFPTRTKLIKRLKEVLEDDVLQKYYLSDKMLNSFVRKSRDTGYKFNPKKRKDSYRQCLTARYYKMGVCDPYIEEELDKVGYINRDTQSGRVYSPNGVAPTLSALGGGLGAKTGLFEMTNKIRRLTPRECSRIQGDFSDCFVFGNASDTKLYEFIGNAIDINTYRRLLRQMLNHTKDASWNNPNKPCDTTFKQKEIQRKNLFGEEI